MNKKNAMNKAIQNVKNKTKTKSKTKSKLNPGLQAFLNKKKKKASNKKKMAQIMATSNSRDFELDVSDAIEEAYERCLEYIECHEKNKQS